MTSRFELVRAAAPEAARLLGLQHPYLVFVRSYEWGDGRYIGFVDGGHRIGVAADLSARQASQTLWHELTHALQVERLGSEAAFRSLWWAQMRELGLTRQEAARATGRRYSHAPLEAEAEANVRLHRQLALAIPHESASWRSRVRRAWP